jgi:protein phosphatase PTC7
VRCASLLIRSRLKYRKRSQGLSVGVADGVGGWEDVTNPALFSQALMYHCHRYAKRGWAGEPETDPTQGYEERETIEGWELTPAQCLENAHTAVLREKWVVAGESLSISGSSPSREYHSALGSSTATILNFNASSGILRTLKCAAHL